MNQDEAPSFSTTCDKCQHQVDAPNASELERLWEEHKREHRSEEAQVFDIEGAKLQAKQAEVTLAYKNEQDHTDDLAKHYQAVSQLEKRLPQLIDFGFKLANMVGNICNEKGWRPKALKEGQIYWVARGEVSVEFTYDKYDLSVPAPVEYLKRGYVRLPQLQADYPAVFEFLMTLGHHLTNMLQVQRLQPRDISFANLHHFVNPNNRIDNFAFKIVNRRQVLKHSRAQL